jgi:hypothetical protein
MRIWFCIAANNNLNQGYNLATFGPSLIEFPPSFVLVE